MAGTTEVGFILQCVLCGSYSVGVVDSLDPDDISRRASTAGHKILQRDVRVLQQDLLEKLQQRLDESRDGGELGDTHAFPRWFVLFPCSVCVEIESDQLFGDWLEDRSNLEKPITLCPQVPVTFAAGELPPAYVMSGHKWLLAQGVGPKDLDLRLPNHLPSQQFRTLLPELAAAVRPRCRQGQSVATESSQVWNDRRSLSAAVGLLLERVPSTSEEGRLGALMPWLTELLVEAETAWQESAIANSTRSRPTKRGGCTVVGSRYVRVPLLRVASELAPIAEAQAAAEA